ncbi:hypothetical protein Cme02nite_59190 [Catellatospora methionotrophica]|uniref:Uncharacterized protein n=1 Tax=Catellatospora methionotrophica TaxID=121620 RepID=A0A8J3LE63_9ACTN|nr:hypothetical protein [Catellatospora methionotrophica]GIG17587.1 hypothetical protein Cme02nite_59190 [Catellatospora methionotrophica]
MLAAVPPLHASALRHATTGLTTAAALLAGRGRRTVDAWPGLPALPAAWTADPGSRISTATQRFAAYRRGAVEIQVHSVLGFDEDTLERQIARINLGPHRVRVSAGTTWRGFEARWACDDVAHRLVCRGPQRLADFLDLLLGLDWDRTASVE